MNPSRILMLMCPLTGIALGPIACDRGDEPIRTYTAPKDPPKVNHPPVGDPRMAGRPQQSPQAAGESKIHWSVPEGWREIAPRPMSSHSFALDDAADPLVLTVSEMGQQELVSNVNRWRNQVGLPNAAADEVAKTVVTKEIAGLKGEIVDLAGADKRMLAAILSGGGKSWVFKVMGAPDRVAAQKDKFDAFLNSVHLDGPDGHGHGGAAQAPSADGPKYVLVGWELPAGWRHDSAPRTMREATFFTAQAGGAEVAVTRMPPNAMSEEFLRQNVSMWHGQVGLPPDSKMPQFAPAEVGGHRAAMLEFVGPGKDNQPTRMHVAIAQVPPQAGETWFFKMVGPDDVVKAQAPAFQAFLKSLRLQPSAQGK